MKYFCLLLFLGNFLKLIVAIFRLIALFLERYFNNVLIQLVYGSDY